MSKNTNRKATSLLETLLVLAVLSVSIYPLVHILDNIVLGGEEER